MLHSVSDKAECLGLSRRHRGHKARERQPHRGHRLGLMADAGLHRGHQLGLGDHGERVRTTRAGRRRRVQSLSRRKQERAPLGLRSKQDVTDDCKKEKKRGPVRSVAEVRWLSIPLDDGEVVSDTSKDTTNYYLFI